MSSKADDFDVRYRDAGRRGGSGGYGGTVDYDLGYDASGWDTDGFRRPEADLPGTGYQTSEGGFTGGRREAGHAGHARNATGTRDSRPSWEPDATGAWGPHGPDGLTAPAGSPIAPGPRRQLRRGRERDQRPVKVKGSWWRHWTPRKAIGLLLATVGGFIVLAAIAIVVTYEETPVPTDAMAATGYSQSEVLSANGTLIGRFGTTNRKMLSYSTLSQSKWLIDSVLAAEDRNFYHEGGISPTGIARAAYEDVKGNDGSLQGGSTITQEFVRQYYTGIGTQQTLSRKIKEIFVSMKVAKEKSKQWIITNFLNTIYLGDGAYGIGAAAQTYFNEPVTKLTAAQAAVIAAIIQQPSTYPLPQYHAQLVARWHYVLNGLVQMGDLTQQQADALKFPRMGDYVPRTVGKNVWDPYVMDVVYNELTDVYHLTQSQIYNGGYVIRTTVDDAKMSALYQAVQQNEVTMAEGGVALPDFAHVGAVLENPANGAIEAMYPGPGYPGSKYVDNDGAAHTMTAKECKMLDCEVNMAVYNREQVGSSFKPYVLSTAVSQGMNVQTSMLDGYDPLYIPPATDTGPNVYATSDQADAGYQWYKVTNDSASEDGPFTPQLAMAESINTAYADLWQKAGAAAVLHMAQEFGVNTSASGLDSMEDEAGVALGQASLTVAEQATMLATIDDGGVYHDAHVVASITRNGVSTPVQITSHLVFNPNPALNAEEATQVQYAMSEDTAAYGTAPTAALSNGQEIIAKTGTTTHYQSAFFIGAIPSQALAVGIFTNRSVQSLPSDLGGNSQGGYGGTWPAAIWHTYAENEFVPLGVESFTQPTFTGSAWNLLPPGLRVAPAKPVSKHHGGQNGGNPFSPPGGGGGNNGNPNPYPTYTCDPTAVTCGGAGGADSVSATGAGAAVGGVFAGLPATCLWVRRRTRRAGPEARLDRGVGNALGPADTRFGDGPARLRPGAIALALGSTSVLAAASVLAMVLAFAEKYPCRAGAWNSYPRQFQDSCYTDIYPLYYAEGLAQGKVPYTGHPVEYPVLIGGAMQVAAWLVRNGSVIVRGREFFDVTVVLLAVCAVAGVLGTAWSVAPERRWQALMVAFSPALILSAFINWDLIAMALTALGVAAWAARRGVWAGVLLGLGVAAKFYPLVVFGPLLLLCLRTGQLRAFAKTLAAGAIAWLAVDLPVMIVAPSGWAWFYVFSKDRPADWGSIWYLLEHFNVPVLGDTRLGVLNALSAAAFVAAFAAIALLALAAPRRPRLPQLCFLVLAAFLMTNKVWSPQYIIWLVPLAVLARPRAWPYVLWQLAEVGYFFGIWGYLLYVYRMEGNAVTGYQGISTGWYFALLLARFLAVALLAAYVVRDVLRPERDSVRAQGADDPAGGVLDQAPDWFRLRLVPRPGLSRPRLGETGVSRPDAALAS